MIAALLRRPVMISRILRPAVLLCAAVLAATGARADLKISAKPTQHVKCSQGKCHATGSKAVLNVGDLAQMLASRNITVQSAGQNRRYRDRCQLLWTSTSRLTLDSAHSIIFNDPVEVMGAGGLTIAPDSFSGGDFRFFGKGNVTFSDLKSSLIINGKGYALANSVAQIKKLINGGRGDQYIALAEQIDASKYQGGVLPFEPTILEGLGNRISNLTISSTAARSNVGLFASAATVRDLGLVNANITGFGDDQAVGAIAGRVDGAILYSFVTGKVSAFGNESGAGGIAGSTNGIVAGPIDRLNFSPPSLDRLREG